MDGPLHTWTTAHREQQRRRSRLTKQEPPELRLLRRGVRPSTCVEGDDADGTLGVTLRLTAGGRTDKQLTAALAAELRHDGGEQGLCMRSVQCSFLTLDQRRAVSAACHRIAMHDQCQRVEASERAESPRMRHARTVCTWAEYLQGLLDQQVVAAGHAGLQGNSEWAKKWLARHDTLFFQQQGDWRRAHVPLTDLPRLLRWGLS